MLSFPFFARNQARSDPGGARPPPSRQRRAYARGGAGALRCLGKEHLREVRHHKAPKPGISVPTRRTGTAL